MAPKTKTGATPAKQAPKEKAPPKKRTQANKGTPAQKATSPKKRTQANKATPALKPTAAKKRTPAKANPSAPATEDPRFMALLAAFAADPELAPVAAAFAAARRSGGGRRFGSNGLKADGQLFALLVRGQLVVKLPAARVAALIAAGDGAPFTAGGRRTMKEWLTVTSHDGGWEALAREAYAFVKGARARTAARGAPAPVDR